MKKLIAVVAAAIVGASSMFALGNAIDVNFNVPMSTDIQRNDSISAKDVCFDLGFGFDVSDTVKLSKLLGIKANAGFWWPSQENHTITIGSTTKKYEIKFSEQFTSCFDFDLFVGAAISPIVNKNGLSVIVTPGVACNWFTGSNKSGDTTTTLKHFHFGVGAEVGVTYSIMKNIYINVGCPLVYYLTEQIDGETNDDFKGAFSFTPKIGIGYLF